MFGAVIAHKTKYFSVMSVQLYNAIQPEPLTLSVYGFMCDRILNTFLIKMLDFQLRNEKKTC